MSKTFRTKLFSSPTDLSQFQTIGRSSPEGVEANQIDCSGSRGEAAARKLWAEAAVKIMPGQFMTREVPGSEGVGTPYIRLALVHDLATTTEALERLSNTL